MASRKQKAVFVYEVGKPVRLGERDIPSPKAGEVLVKVNSVQLLPHDSYGRDFGLFIGEKLPYILGSSVAGTVEAAGPNVKAFKAGDRVFGTSNVACPTPDQAGLQEYAILQTDSIAHSPASFSNDQVATMCINAATDVLALFTEKFGFGFQAPWDENDETNGVSDFDPSTSPIVIIGAGTNVGKIFLQFAHTLLGIKNLIAVASPANTVSLKAAGALHVIDRHLSDADQIAAVHAAAGGADKVTRIVDCASWDYHFAASMLAEGKPSRLLTLHIVDEAVVQKVRPECRASTVMYSNANLGAHAAAFWRTLPKWLEDGVVEPTGFKTLDGLDNVDQINAQLDDYAALKAGPQLIVHP